MRHPHASARAPRSPTYTAIAARFRVSARPRVVRLLLLLCLLTIWATAPAQEPAPDPPDTAGRLDPTLKSTVTPEFLETKIEETEAATDLDAETKSKLTEQYRKALSELQAANALESKAAAYKDALQTAPSKAEAIRTELAAAPNAPLPAPPADASITEIEQQLAKTQADSSAVEAKLTEIDKELESSATRPSEARQAISRAKNQLEELEASLKLPPPPGEAADLSDARRWAFEARRQSLRSEILMLDQELLSQSARIDLLKAARDKAARDLGRLETAEQKLGERLNALLRAQAAEAAVEASKAEREATDKHSLIRDLAHRNATLSAELTATTNELNRLTGIQKQIEEEARRVTDDYRSARQRVEVAGLTQALGQVLIDQRNQLPELRSYRKAASERETAITEATLHQIRYGDERRLLRDPNRYIEDLAGDRVEAGDRADVIAELRKLAEQRSDLLDQALRTDEAYLRVLGEVEYASSQLMEVAQDYDDFLSERLLWVRSSSPVTLTTFANLPKAALWAISPANWLEVARVLLHEAGRSPLFWLLLVVVALLDWKARAMRRRIRASGEPLRRIRSDSIVYTLEALGLTLLLAAPLALLLALLGWQLYGSLEATSFTKAIGEAAISVSLGLYYLRSFRVLCMPGGVADRHFRWSGEILVLLRRNFDWLLVVLVPLGFVATAAYNHPNVTYSGSLGRLSLIALTIGLSLFFARVLHPQRGALRNLIAEQPDGWFSRLRKIWYPLAVGMPLALSVLTAVGYLYTTGILLRSLISSMYLVLAITVVHQLVIRWLSLTRRRLALQAALERRAARASESAESSEDENASVLSQRAEEAEEVDFASLDEQTRRLINTLLFIGGAVALWAIWSHVLPAFGIFEEVALWHHTGVVDGEERIIPVTLADIGLVLLIALIATVAVKNLPALLEILLLSKMSVSSGSRYAVKTLTGYVITATAALTAFSTLGLSWGQVQWLVAALGVGIGFGLQEIVANFISGIIILFERPVRVGDVVTIGDTTGSVSKIRIRATTIRNWDKQELLVPNKEFITGRLLNWTLSDNLNRIVVTVGVDYGSDVPLALRLLEEAAKEDGRILDDPQPLITFEGFGDNALNLVLRCYLETLDDRLAVVSGLHQRINEKFQAAGISIAFPQRDVHLSTARPLDVRIQPAGAGVGDEGQGNVD